MVATEKLACAPKMGDYHIIINMLIERCLGYKTMLCPPVTKRTIELGGRHSPDMICTPFKTTLGNFIEAAEQGANVFIMPGAGCRLGLYDILQQQIMHDLGYDCEIITLFDYIPTVNRLYKAMNDINPDLSREEFDIVLETIIRITVDMDELADTLRKNAAFELEKGAFERLYNAYLQEVSHAQNADEAASIGEEYRKQMRRIETNKPEKPIRIGIVGEIYLVVEPSSNCYLEKWLMEHNVEIVSPFNLSRMAVAVFTVDEQVKNSGGYVDYNIGSTANDAIAHAYEMMQDGIDGIIHVKPA